MDYIRSTLPQNFIVNHERWNNKEFEVDHTSFRLFWTSPGDKSYYRSKLVTYKFELDREMKGISLTSSPSDLEVQFSSIPDYGLHESCDAFKNIWYAILEKDLLGLEVDFINLYDTEIIFSNKNMKHLKQI